MRLFAALALLLIGGVAQAQTTWYVSPTGSSGNDGLTEENAKNAAWCNGTGMTPGDTCMFLAGNYGGFDLTPGESGTNDSTRITFECQTLYGCSIDRILITGRTFLTFKNLKSDSNFFDSSHSFTQPRVDIHSSSWLKFDSVFIRGEEQACADGNPGTSPDGLGCSAGFSRYNDVFEIGGPQGSASSAVSHHIEIAGATQIVSSNHTLLQIYGDGDATTCEENEGHIWIHGTPEQPVIFDTLYHHTLAIKAGCEILIEWVDFQQSGTGYGDVDQPDGSSTSQSGETLHGASAEHYIVRFSTISAGGTGTSEWQASSHIGLGAYTGNNDELGARRHGYYNISHYRPWGPTIDIARLNDVSAVTDITLLNHAISEGYRLQAADSANADNPNEYYAVLRRGSATSVDVEIDGFVVGNTQSANNFLRDQVGTVTSLSISGAPGQTVDGVAVGSNITANHGAIFTDPENRNFEPAHADLIDTAEPLATAIGAGTTSTSLTVTRPWMFMGTMDGMRDGDVIDVGGTEATVEDVNLSTGVLTLASAISWSDEDEIYPKPDELGVVHNEIGAYVSPSDPPDPPPDPPPASGGPYIGHLTAQLASDTTPTDVCWSGKGTPTGAFVVGGYSTAVSTLTAHAGLSIGATDFTRTANLHMNAEDAQATSDANRSQQETNIFEIHTAGTGTVIRSVVATAITDCVRLTPQQSGSQYQVSVTAFFDVPVYVGSGCEGTVLSGTCGFTHGLSVTPKAGIWFKNRANAGNGVHGEYGLGFHTHIDSTITQVSLSQAIATAVPDGAAYSRLYSDRVMSSSGTDGNPSGVLELTANDSTTTTITNRSATLVGDVNVLLVGLPDNVSAWTGLVSAPTATGLWEITTPGFEPQFLIGGLTNMNVVTGTGDFDDVAAAGVTSIFATNFAVGASVNWSDENAADPTISKSFFSPNLWMSDDSGVVMFRGVSPTATATGWSVDITSEASATSDLWPFLAIELTPPTDPPADAPVCSQIGNLRFLIDTAITPIDLNDYCDDPQMEDITYTSTSLPTGLSLGGTGNATLSGTPTVEDTVGTQVTFTATNESMVEATFDATFFIVDQTTVPDTVGSTEAAAGAALDAAFLTLGTTTEVCSSVFEEGRVVSSDPEADTVVDALSSVDLEISDGTECPSASIQLRGRGVTAPGLSPFL